MNEQKELPLEESEVEELSEEEAKNVVGGFRRYRRSDVNLPDLPNTA